MVWTSFILHLSLAALLGAIIGAKRQCGARAWSACALTPW